MCFSYTDEAFGLLLVVNYENRWRSQHTTEKDLPDGTGKECSQRWQDEKYTLATEGAQRGASWPREELMRFNELSAMVKSQRDTADEVEENNKVEAELMDWCRIEDCLAAMAVTVGNTIGSGAITSEEDEVEA